MTYSAGNLIVATDYNGFVNGNANNINAVWSTGTGTTGYGQTAQANVSVGSTITATQWSGLNSKITSMGGHTGTTLTSRTNPVAGNTIAILANLATDINNITLNHGNAAILGTQNTAWTGQSSQTANITTANAWVLTFRHDVTWANASAARFFFNGGGLVELQTSKTSTGQSADAEWNSLATTECGSIFITTGGYTQYLAGNAYTGTTKVGGTGSPTTLTTGTGFNQFTTANTSIYKQYSNIYGYTQNYIEVTANVNANTNPTVMTLFTTWNASINDAYHPSANITGGTNTSGISFGTAPSTVVTYFPPESTYLTETVWGTPTVTASVANTVTAGVAATYLVVGGGGGGGSGSYNGSGGGGAGGYLAGNITLTAGYTYTITVGAGGTASFPNPGNPGARSSIIQTNINPQPLVLSLGGGGGGGANLPDGLNGGSGGGAATGYQYTNPAGGQAGLGVTGQGYNGGTGRYIGFDAYGGGGGGGSGGVGGSAVNGAGGASTSSTITGSSVARAGGGGGSVSGAGGGGGATAGSQTAVAAATTNTGSGGGGSSHIPTPSDSYLDATYGRGGSGGSGIVILSVPTASYTGTTTGSPTVSTSGANTIMQFTASGTYTA
jgi:hypothetical protein